MNLEAHRSYPGTWMYPAAKAARATRPSFSDDVFMGGSLNLDYDRTVRRQISRPLGLISLSVAR